MKTKNNKPMKRKGFTLVELSIVLVIIGLLIGGILVAQSMIGTAKLQSGVRQLGQFDASIANFYTKFNTIPGDNSVMGTTSATYNGNGIISDYAGAGCAAGALFKGEIGKFWSDLSASGLKPTGTATGYTDASGTNLAVGTNLIGTTTEYIPQFPLGTAVGLVACGASSQNWYRITAFSIATASNQIVATPTSGLKPADAAAIDAKIDDGVANAGNVTGDDSVSMTSTDAGTTCKSTTAYATATTTSACNLMVRLGIQTGNLQ